MTDYREEFAARLRGGDRLLGVFVKFRDPAIIEVLGSTGLDFAILDAEHAAFDRADIFGFSVASRAARLPLIVRVPDTSAQWISTALDSGAAGVMVPRVSSPKDAAALVKQVRYGPGGRGFSPSVPGAEYGRRGVGGHLDRYLGETLLVCQIEDREAVDRTAEICDVDGIDAIFLGPVDLAVSAGFRDPGSDEVRAMCRRAIKTGATAGKAAGIFVGDAASVPVWEAQGARFFVVGSDQAMIALAGASLSKGIR